jgi:hypothetical protein
MDISTKRLEEILATVNPRTVEKIYVEYTGSCSSNPPTSAKVTIGVREYTLFLADVDDRYWIDGLTYFANIIRNSGVPYESNVYKEQTCSGTKNWSV